jgi:valyl-tRNA synthetase
LASQASPGTDIAFNEQRTEGYRAFANKIWNATRFLFMNVDRAEQAGIFKLAQFATMEEKDFANARKLLEVRWILSRFEKTAQAVNAELSAYRFDEAARSIYQFFWGEFCDWFVELAKLRYQFDNAAQQPLAVECLGISLQVMEGALRLLAPFMPFLTEEIWHNLYDGKPPAKSIALVAYPQGEAKWIDEFAEREMQFLQELIVLIREMRAEAKLVPKEHVEVVFHGSKEHEQLIRANEQFLTKLAGVSAVNFMSASPAAQFHRSTPSFDVALIYELKVETAPERTRLEKEIAQLERELDGKQKQLSNDAFTAKAPAHIVDGLRKRSEEITTILDKSRAALSRLG